MGQDLLENDTAWPNPVWSPRLFQPSTLAKMLISWLVSSPNLDQVHRFKGSKRLAHCSVAELGEDSSSSSADCYFFSFLSSLNQPLKVHGGIKLAESPIVLISKRILTAKCPLKRAKPSSKFRGIERGSSQSQRHLWVLTRVFEVDCRSCCFHILDCSFNSTVRPGLLLRDEVLLDVQLRKKLGELRRGKGVGAVHHHQVRFGVVT